MIKTVIDSVKKCYEEHGVGTAILAFILLLGVVFGILCVVIAIAAALWNGVLTTLFPVIPEITFWQMWGIYLLFDILFKPSTSSNQ